MSRDYKPSPERSKNTSRGKGSPLLTGLIIGFLLGIAASLSVVMFIKGGESPFINKAGNDSSKLSEKIAAKNKDKSGRGNDKAGSEESGSDNSALPTTESPASAKADDKTRFDFYTILPGSESKVTKEEENKIKEGAPQPTIQKSYFLQVADPCKSKIKSSYGGLSQTLLHTWYSYVPLIFTLALEFNLILCVKTTLL